MGNKESADIVRTKIYKLLEKNNATDKLSWWNVADDVYSLLAQAERVERKRITRLIIKHSEAVGWDKRALADVIEVIKSLKVKE